MRSWRKETGPGWPRRNVTATTANFGDRTSSKSAAPQRSMKVFIVTWTSTGIHAWALVRALTTYWSPRRNEAQLGAFGHVNYCGLRRWEHPWLRTFTPSASDQQRPQAGEDTQNRARDNQPEGPLDATRTDLVIKRSIIVEPQSYGAGRPLLIPLLKYSSETVARPPTTARTKNVIFIPQSWLPFGAKVLISLLSSRGGPIWRCLGAWVVTNMSGCSTMSVL